MGLTLVTTEKDFARLRGGSEMPASVRDIVPFKVALEFADAAALRKFLSDRLFKAREKKFSANSPRRPGQAKREPDPYRVIYPEAEWLTIFAKRTLVGPTCRQLFPSSARPENAAAAPQSAPHRPPAGRRSSISARRAESVHR